MNKRLLRKITIIAAMLAAAFMSWRIYATRLVLVTHTDMAVWSKDGQALYYAQKDSDGLRVGRYDVASGENKEYIVPRSLDFDVSPDGKSVVLLPCNLEVKYPGIIIYNLESGAIRTVYNGCSKALGHVLWLPKDLMLFSEQQTRGLPGDPKDGHWHIYTIRPDGTGKTLVTDDAGYSLPFAAYDGSGFVVYRDTKCYFVDLATKKMTLINPKAADGSLRRIAIAHLTRNRILYYYRTSDRAAVTESLDLRTMHVQKITNMPQILEGARISPDLSRYYALGRGDYHRGPDLYIGNMPSLLSAE